MQSIIRLRTLHVDAWFIWRDTGPNTTSVSQSTGDVFNMTCCSTTVSQIQDVPVIIIPLSIISVLINLQCFTIWFCLGLLRSRLLKHMFAKFCLSVSYIPIWINLMTCLPIFTNFSLYHLFNVFLKWHLSDFLDDNV